MNEAHLYDRILGSLATAALGDALGAGTEQWTTQEIIAKHGGLLRELITPPNDTFSAGNRRGEITDDTSMMFAMAELIVARGKLDVEEWTQTLVRWSQTSPHARMMGPSSRPILEALAAGKDHRLVGVVGNSKRQGARMGTSNGAAMRVAPAALIHPGDWEGACQTAVTSCFPTHETQIGAAGACAIAAGVAEALKPTADVYAVVRACLWGARRGEELGKQVARTVAGANIAARIEWALSLVMKARSMGEALATLEAHIGNSVAIAETVPTAIGIFAFTGGDPLETIVGGANIGNDTDTIAAIAGMLAGALKGFKAVPAEMYATVRQANNIDIEALARGLTAIALRNHA